MSADNSDSDFDSFILPFHRNEGKYPESTDSDSSDQNMYDHQRQSIIQNLNHLRHDDNLSDITFVIGRGDNIERIGGVRALFAAQSDVFKNMLYGNFIEALKDEIIIEDEYITSESFNYMKHIFYCGSPKLKVNACIDILYISQKYLLKNINQNVTEFILNSSFNFYEKRSIFKSLAKYPPLQFEELLNKFIQCISFTDIQNIIKSNPQYLTVDQAKLMIKQRIKNYEIRYELIKIFCSIYANNHDNDNNNHCIKWQDVMRKHFIDIINFSTFHVCILFGEVKTDGILTNDELSNAMDGRSYFENGYRTKEILLTRDQIHNGDKIDFLVHNRWRSGKYYFGSYIVEDGTNKKWYYGKHCIVEMAKYNSTMQKKQERLWDLCIGDTIYVRDPARFSFTMWTQQIVTKVNGLYVNNKYHLNGIDEIKQMDL